jgi:NitT/TauT family transport system substrate-binding protein
MERNMKNRPRGAVRGGVIGLALVFALAACSAGSSGSSSPSASAAAPGGSTGASEAASATPAPATLKVGVSAEIFAFSPLYVAKEKGFWKDENLDVELTFFNSGTEAQQALLGGAIDVGAGGYTEPMTLTGQGTPTGIIAATQSGLPYKLVARPEIKSLDQIVGKTLGVSKVGSLSDQITHIALTKAGIDPSKVKIQQAGGSSSRMAAIQSGAIDGTILSSPDDQLAIKAGMTMLLDVGKELPGFAYEVVYAKKSNIEAKHDVYLRFMKGLIRGAQYVTDPANEEEVLKIASDTINQPVDDLKVSYDDTIQDFPKDSAADANGIQQALDGTKQFGELTGAKDLTVDDIFYPELQKEAASALGVK